MPTIVCELRRHLRNNAWAVRVPRKLRDDYLRAMTAEEDHVARARALHRPRARLGDATWAVVAQLVGLSRRHVHNVLNTERLPAAMREAAVANGLTEKDVRALSLLRETPFAQGPLWRRIEHERLSGDAISHAPRVSLGMLAVPVLAGSAYATAEAKGWGGGLDLDARRGRHFYGVIAGAMLIGLGLNVFGVNPLAALVFVAVFNGVAAVPLIWSSAVSPPTAG